MPRKFFNFNRSSAPKGRTKPITRQYFTGSSHFLDANGNVITPSLDPKSPYFKYTYQNGPNRGKLNISRLRNVQLYRNNGDLVNEFPDMAGSGIGVPFELVINHLQGIIHRGLKVKALAFEVKMAKEAAEVFQRSFVDNKFRDYGSKLWKPLAPYTVKQRRKHGTNPNNILYDTGTMKRSIHAIDGKGIVRTDPTMYGTARRHKGVCYAGIHNDPDFFGAKNVAANNHQVAQRQFMGHSSYMRNEGWALARLYLFDELFTPIV